MVKAVILLMTFFLATDAKALSVVPIYLLEALAPRDSTSTESFRKEFESAVDLSKTLLNQKVSQCGFKIETKVHLYSANDSLQAYEYALDAEKSGAWLIVGPRRSNHYLLLTKGAALTPSVSVMASAKSIESLQPLHLTIYPSNSMLAVGAAKAVQENFKNPQYYTVVSEDCLICKEFSETFDSESKKRGSTKVGEIGIVGDNPNTSKIVKAIVEKRPNIVVLPNYSKVSAILMGAIRKKINVTFVGGDGWGDENFGFVERNPQVLQSSGYSVRGFPPVKVGLKMFPLGQQVLNLASQHEFFPSSGPSLAVLRIFQGIGDLLCTAKPSNRNEFREVFMKSGSEYFSSPWGISLYRLNNGRMGYWKAIDFK